MQTTMGRGLSPSDAIEGRDPEPVAVLAYEFWQERLGGDPDAIGKTLQLDRKNYTIVGVAGRRFRWYSADVYLPLNLNADPNHFCIVDFYLRPGVARQATDAALEPLLQQFAREMPKRFPERFHVHVEGLNAWVERSIGRTLYLLLGAVALLLGIGCGNVSILLLAQGRAAARVRGACRGGGTGRPHDSAAPHGVDVAGRVGAALVWRIVWNLAGIKAVLPRFAFAPEVVSGSTCGAALQRGVAIATALYSASGLRSSWRERGRSWSPTRRVMGSVRGRRTQTR